SDAADGDGGRLPERGAAGQPQPAVRGQAGAAHGRLAPAGGRQADANAQQLRQGGIQRRRGPGGGRRRGNGRGVGAVSAARRAGAGPLRGRRGRRADAGVLHHRAQKPGERVSGGDFAVDDAALHDAAAQLALHRGDAGQAAGGHRGQPAGAADGAGRRQRRAAAQPAGPAAARNRGGGDGSMRGPSGRPAALLGHKGLVVLFAVLIVLAVPAWSGPWDGPWDGPWNGPWIGPGSGWWSGAGTARAQGLQFGVHVAGEAGSFWWHLPLAASLGAGMAPLEFRWDLVEPVPGRFEWARFDAAVEAARASGMRLVGVLHYPAGLPPLSRMSRPGWPRADVDDWDYFVERVASRYGGEIEDWVVVRGRAGRRDPILGAAEADLDAQLVRTTAAALKRTQPRARLLALVPGADLRW